MRRSRADGLFHTRSGMPLVSLVRSVQRGTITIAGASTSNTATINAVNTDRAVLKFLGCTVGGVENPSFVFARVALTNATTVTATKGNSDPGADDVVVSYEVVEYGMGLIRSIQRGTITAAAGTATATINAVNTEKSTLDYLGMSTVNTQTDNTWVANVDLQDATTVRASALAADATVGFQVVEWQ